MKRRNIIGQAIGITGAAGAGCLKVPVPETDDLPRTLPVVNWRMHTSWSESRDVFQRVLVLCQRIAEMTNRRFVIKPYEGTETDQELEKLFDAVVEGKSETGEKVQCGHTALYYFVKEKPALAFGAAVPFGFNTQQQHAWLYSGGGIEALQKVLNDDGLVWFPAGNTTGQMGGWFRQPIDTVKDLKTLKMRIAGLGTEVLEYFGAETVTLPPDDIVAAWHEDRINAAEWIGPSEDKTLGLNNIARYYYYPGWWEPGTSFAILVNQSEWDDLPKTYQAVFKAAAMEANLDMLTQYNINNGEALKSLQSEGTTIRRFNDEFLKECRQATFDLYESKAEKDDEFNTVYRQWQNFRDRLYRWHRVSSLSFSQFAYNQEL